MAIGNPITLTSNVASKTISVIATAGQTLFTVTGGYRINQLAVFRNGVRLLDSRDYEARNGSTVTLLSAATVGDALEFQVFDDFRVADAIVSAESEQTISGNLTVSGILTATDLRGSDVTFRHVKATGISTVSDTTQTTSTTTGALVVSGGVGIAKSLFVGGDMQVAGTLSYEDVTNTETAGITTTGGLVVTGLGATFGSGVGIADSIYHIGDSNTAIRFPAADNFTVETGGSERFRVGPTGISTFTGNVSLIAGGAERLNLAHVSGGDVLIKNPTDAYLAFGTNNSERVRIDSIGRLLVGTDTNRSSSALQVEGTSFATSRLSLTQNSATANAGATLKLSKSRGTSNNSNTVVVSGDRLGNVQFSGADGSGDITAATIEAFVDAAPGTNDMPGRIVFSTTADGAASATERLRIDSSGNVIVNGTAAGSNAKFEVQSTTGSISSATLRVTAEKTTTGAINTGSTIILAGHDGGNSRDFASLFAGKENGTGSNFDAYLAFGTRSNGSALAERLRIDSSGRLLINTTSVIGGSTNALLHLVDASGPEILFGRNDSTTAAGNDIGKIRFFGNDGGSYQETATISAKADLDHANNDKPGRLVFSTTADGGSSVTERLRIDSSGRVTVFNGGSNQASEFNAGANQFVITNNNNCGLTIDSTSSTSGSIHFADGPTGNESYRGIIEYDHSIDSMKFYTSATERLSIDSNGNFIFKNGALIENGFHDDGGGMTGDYNHDLGTYGNVHYAATNPAGSYTYNLRINSSTSVNSVMAEGDTLSFTFINNISGNTGRYMTAFKIDGTTQTVEWAGGSAPSENSGSGSDVYSFTIIKTANATFKVFGSFTNHD